MQRYFQPMPILCDTPLSVNANASSKIFCTQFFLLAMHCGARWHTCTLCIFFLLVTFAPQPKVTSGSEKVNNSKLWDFFCTFPESCKCTWMFKCSKYKLTTNEGESGRQSEGGLPQISLQFQATDYKFLFVLLFIMFFHTSYKFLFVTSKLQITRWCC